MLEFVMVCMALLLIGILLAVKMLPSSGGPGAIVSLDAGATKNISDDK